MLSPAVAHEARPGAIDVLRRAGCVFAEREVELLCAEASDLEAFQAMVHSRAAGVPLEWVVGWAGFCDVRVPIDPGVFVPRRRSERMATIALGLLRHGDQVLDLGCGSGALALVLARSGLPATVTACDVDPRAVASASRALAGTGAHVFQSDLFTAVPAGQQFDIIVANLPYVPTSELRLLPSEARAHEPTACLDGGEDGLQPLRRAATDIGDRLSGRGTFMTELHADQVATATQAVQNCGLRVSVRKGGGGTRILLARHPR